MRLVLNDPEGVAAWVGGRIGIIIVPPYSAIGWTDDERTYCGGAVFNNYNGSNIDFNYANDTPPTRGVIRALHHYCFDQLKVNRVSAITRRSNKLARKYLPRLGFVHQTVRVKYFGPNRADDGFEFVLFPEARKF